MAYLGIFGMELENNIVIFEICDLEFVYVQSFVKEMSKFGNKNILFAYFWASILEIYCHI